jgi:hypothetical protein
MTARSRSFAGNDRRDRRTPARRPVQLAAGQNVQVQAKHRSPGVAAFIGHPPDSRARCRSVHQSSAAAASRRIDVSACARSANDGSHSYSSILAEMKRDPHVAALLGSWRKLRFEAALLFKANANGLGPNPVRCFEHIGVIRGGVSRRRTSGLDRRRAVCKRLANVLNKLVTRWPINFVLRSRANGRLARGQQRLF